MVMERSSPKTLCQTRAVVLFWSGRISSKILCNLSTRWGGSWMVLSTVSNNQPNTTFRVLQTASPFFNFFTEAGSCLVGLSPASRGRNTLSNT